MTRLSALTLTPGDPSPAGSLVISVNDRPFGQAFEGVGAAPTDSSAAEISSLATPTRTALMTGLFSRAGIGLNFLRVPIGASDFDVDGQAYTYDDAPPGGTDPTLRYFSIRHDELYILPLLRLALRINPNLITEASPWTAPVWMRSNDSLFNFQWSGALLPRYYATFALYLYKFLEAYQTAGVPIRVLTPQNEPNVPGQYPAMTLSPPGYLSIHTDPAVEATIITDLERDMTTGQSLITTAIFGVEASWDRAYAATYLLHHDAIVGIEWHCYTDAPSVMTQFSDVPQYVSECATELNGWSDADYLTEMFRDGASVAALWNLALHPTSGPFVGTDLGCLGCEGVVTINTAASVATPLAYNERYYTLGQFGHFVQPGARRIAQTPLRPSIRQPASLWAPSMM
jgi:glucosylceramidase